MAKNHSSVAYVEPNYTYSGLTLAANDGTNYDRAPDLENYCIALDIIVELSSRHISLSGMAKENSVIVMSYNDSSGGKSNVRFMSGTRIGGYERDNAGEYRPRLGGENVLTSYYADMHITDLVNYGTTEMLGIKSVDVEYNSTCVPVITVRFTDVRGMSLFQPSELNDSTSYNGIRGFSKDNIAQSFFHSFFTLPLPKFTVVLKGFYGNPVSYQVMCDKFDTAFDSQTGSFDVTARFIGFAYSFMADVSFNALLAAPYSDYKGEEYWDSQVKAERFILPDKNGNPTKMPKLYEIRRDFETLMNESDTQSHDSAADEEKKKHEIEIEQLTKLRRMYRNWYDTFFSLAKTKYGNNFCYRLGGTSEDDDYRSVIILTNGENIKGNDFSEEYKQFDEFFRTMTGQLKAAIDEYNNSGDAYRKLDNILDGFKYPRVKTFRDIWYDRNTGKFKFDGFHSDNILPRQETLNEIFGKTEESQQKALRILYNDGKSQYIDAFVINLDYTDILKRINRLNELASVKLDDQAKKRKALNRHMFEKMGWYPSVENFTKIVMAHLETLMAMMYDTVTRAQGRTVSSLGVPTGDAGATDVNHSDDEVAPFPRLTKLITDEDGYSKSEDAWAGDFTDGIGFVEVDMVNGLLNGAAKINQLEKEIIATENNMNTETQPMDTSAVSVIDMPITSYDFILRKDPYGQETDVIDDINAFAGKVCMRMFGVLSLNFFRQEFSSNWLSLADKLGSIEARNFAKLHKITNINLMSAIGENGSLKNADGILDIVTGRASSGATPWTGTRGGNVLFEPGNKMWLTRYTTSGSEKRGIHPLQEISFSSLEGAFGAVEAGKTPFENENIVLFDTPTYIDKDFKKLLSKPINGEVYSRRIFNTIEFTIRYKEIWEKLDNAQSTGSDEYKELLKTIGETIKPNSNSFSAAVILPGSKSFNNIVNSGSLLPKEPGNVIPSVNVGDSDATMFAGGAGDVEAENYGFSGSSFPNETVERNLPSYTLTECFGYSAVTETVGKTKRTVYKMDKSKSLFSQLENITNWVNDEIDIKHIRVAQFLMGFDCINYAHIKDCFGDKAYTYIPTLALLQMGAIIAIFYSRKENTKTKKAKNKITDKLETRKVNEHVVIPEGFHNVVPLINSMSPYCKIGFARYFKDWAWSNYDKVMELKVSTSNGSPICNGPHYEKVLRVNNSTIQNSRLLFRQDSDLIKYFTNQLMSMICIVRLSVNAIEGNGQSDNGMRDKFAIDETQAKVYLNSFLSTLREVNGIADEKKSGDPTTIANNPSQTNDDIKIELYRYLKQVYDKWVASTTMDTWLFDNFFGKDNKDNPLGHNFYFIDSFYNKIDNKLLINPRKISLALKLAISSMDTNVMMYSFLAQVYGEHRCMMKCVQNFKLLSEGIRDVFRPIPYNEMKRPDPIPDFVVIYTYESSRNLNVGNSEYKDDGFMLNDEFDTPLPIKSRGDENRFYKIPAFGVSYGRQYQNYFKTVKVDMAHPVMTEQAIIAKHNILANSRSKTAKNVTGQDLYDIYSNQSYTCVVEMMGCAYIQPLMYFVLLNVPFFRGSYLVSKVKHRMSPGNMVTEVTGVRMSKYSNKIVEDMFTDEMDEQPEGGASSSSERSKLADTSNDCPYSVFPIGEDDGISMTNDEGENANNLMKLLMNNGANRIVAAGIVGNMAVETGPTKTNAFRFNSQALVPNDSGYVAAGLVMWNDSYYSLQQMLNNEYKEYGHKTYKSHYVPSTAEEVKKLLANKTAEYQCKFIVDSLKNNNNQKEKKLWAKLMEAKTAREAAHIFCNGNDPNNKYAGYENPNPNYAKLSDRMDWADKVYKAYSEGGSKPASEKPAETDKVNNPTDYAKLFVAAIQKSLNSTERYAGELNPVYGNEGLVTITMKDNSSEKLAVLFDIILNSETYYNQVFGLQWRYKTGGAPNELPSSLAVTVKPNVDQNMRRIFIHDGTPKSMNGKLTGEECNERFMQSLGKKYGSNKDLFAKECPQFSNSRDCLDKYKPADCNTLYNGNGDAATGSGARITEGGMVGDNWNAKQAANWLVCATQGLKSQSICAFAVQQAVIAGGIDVITKVGGGWKQAVAMYKGGKWDLLESGTVDSKEINFKTQLQVGDIVGMTKGANESDYGHIAMYCGSQKRWVSDYQQGYPYVYTYDKAGKKREPGKYWLIRYKGGEKSVSPNPGRCYGGKCLNNCSV